MSALTSEGAGAIWALTDDRQGNTNQSLGVADALDHPYTIKTLTYNRGAGLPNLVLGATINHLMPEAAAELVPPWPGLVIGAGRRAAAVARHIKHQSREPVFLAQAMWPGWPAAAFDLIAVPEHDRKPAGPNVITTVGAPNLVHARSLDQARQNWTVLARIESPRIALLVGGDTKDHRFSTAHAHKLAEGVRALAEQVRASIMLTTSRRTSPETRAILQEHAPAPAHHYDPHNGGENPYFGYLAHADAIVVTGDSMSMCTEACATGRPVYIYAPHDGTKRKHARLHQKLFDGGYARPLWTSEGGIRYESWDYPPLNDADSVAQEIRRRVSGRELEMRIFGSNG